MLELDEEPHDQTAPAAGRLLKLGGRRRLLISGKGDVGRSDMLLAQLADIDGGYCVHRLAPNAGLFATARSDCGKW